MEDRQKGENQVRETKLRAKSEARIARAKGDKDIATAQVGMQGGNGTFMRNVPPSPPLCGAYM